MLHGALPALLAAVLYNVQFVATAPVAAMWLKYYVRTVEFDTDMGVVPPSVQGPAVHGRRERHGRGVLPHADDGDRGAVQQRQAAQDGRLRRVHA